jgi:O-antigen/teichoic acid export membrane protein
MSNSKSQVEKDLVRSTGRGVLYISFAKMWFMLTGYVLAFGLPLIFKWTEGWDGDKGMALFGAYGIVITGISVINNGIITGTIQAVSKFTSEDETQAGAVRRTALKLQLGIGLVLAVLYAGFAGFLAEYWFKSPGLANLMRISAGVIVAYSCYAVFIGSFNGRRLFHRQALFDICYATLKVALMIGFVFLGFKVLGTVLGFLIAATIIAITAGFTSRIAASESFPAKRYLSFAVVIIGYTFVLNLVLMVDIYLLGGIVPRLAEAAGTASGELSRLTEIRAGQYKAAQTLAFIPYQAIISIAFVVFPMVSRVTFQKDDETARIYVRKTLRFSMILVVGLSAVFAAVPKQALGLVYPPEYQVASSALRILPLGIAAFGIMVISNTLLNAAGHTWRAIAVVLISLVSLVVGVLILAFNAGPGTEVLAAAATGTSIGMVVGLIASGIMVTRRFGTFWPWATAMRVFVAAGVAIGAGYFMPDAGKVMTLIECTGVLLIYFVVLVVTREFVGEDLDYLRQIFGKKKK